ncbi:BnaA05g11410D [Brassica napus]|uniref:BnaA05g11410D protein n=3 Tax=Brassica TaxID=3705 RepID=A0A078F8K4_BRANA|nr:BnaA05g11410D [Brassica napus]
MMMKKQVILGVILIALFLISMHAKQVGATRLLRTPNDSEIRFVVFQSLQMGSVPESDRNGCSHLPNDSGKCHG